MSYETSVTVKTNDRGSEPDAPCSTRRLALETAAVGGAFTLLFALKILPANGIYSIDAFYHFKIARLMAQTGPVIDITWLPLTILGEAGPDHHWLWHLLLAPFGWIRNELTGLKWALVFNATLVPTAFYLACRRLGLTWPVLWTVLLFAGGTSFLSRLLMLRAQNIAIVYLLIFLVLLIQQRFRWLALVAFVFLQSYHGALIVLIPVAIYFLASGLRLHHWRWDLLLAVATGFTAALVINPWFPSNIEYLWFHTAFKVLNPQNLQVGPEWDSKTWALIYSEAWASHWLLLTGIAMSICYQRELLKRPQVFTLLAFTLFTLVL